MTTCPRPLESVPMHSGRSAPCFEEGERFHQLLGTWSRSLLGVPIRPDDIEELARRMNNAVEKTARPDEDPSGDPPE